MASLQQLKDAARQAGFVVSTCPHPAAWQHLVFDYPKVFTQGPGPFWRVHTDTAKIPHVTYLVGEDTPSSRVTLKAAIAFMQRVAEQNPR